MALDSIHQSSLPNFKAKASWKELPDIVQCLILTELANGYNRDLAEDKMHRAAYAAVSLEWQEFFEDINFGKLVLHPTVLGDLEKTIQRRQINEPVKNRVRGRSNKRQKLTAEIPLPARYRMPRIKHIWLRIELQEYTCQMCKVPESGKETVRCVFLQTGPWHRR